ncbi:hypothetical protein ABPG72_008308 [Tetrahymena utriculariae]
MINAQNTSQFYVLTSPYYQDNLQNSVFAEAQLEDINNQDIIGIDDQGKIDIWDLNSPTQNHIKSLQLKNCLKAKIAEIFYYNQEYYLSLQIQPKSNQFDFFMSLYQSQQKFDIYDIELLKDNTLWIQYEFNLIFYPLQSCLDDLSFCISCQNTFYFNIYNQLESVTATYGQGTELIPFTTSNSYIEALLIASHYKDIVLNLINIEINIILDPSNTLTLNEQFLDIQFQKLVSLNIKSKSEKLVQIQYESLMQYNNYLQVNFTNIQINFKDQSCGFQFSNLINSENIFNVQLKSQYDSSNSCQQIIADNSFIQILNYTLDDQNFSKNKFFISTIKIDRVNISNLTLSNSNFGEQFSILYQYTDVQAYIQNLVLQNNYCQINSNTQNSVPLFTASHFTVSDVQKKKQHILLQQYILNNNIIQPSKLNFQIQRNTIIQQHLLYINQLPLFQFPLSFFVLTKTLIDRIIEYSKLVNITLFNCSSQQNFNKNILSQELQGCIQIIEATSVVLNNITTNNKIMQDNSLIEISNNNYKQLQLSITIGLFENLFLSQTQLNSFVNPIHISSSYQADIQISNVTFQNNQLNSIVYSLFQLGQILIQNSAFDNIRQIDKQRNIQQIKEVNPSDIIYSIIQVSNSTVLVQNNSSFSNINCLKCNGGAFFIENGNINIQDSDFQQIQTSFGGAFFINGLFGTNIIKNSRFENLLAQYNGGQTAKDLLLSAFSKRVSYQSIVDKQEKYNENEQGQKEDTLILSIKAECLYKNFNQLFLNSLFNNNIQSESALIYNNQKSSQSTIQILGGAITIISGILDNFFIIGQYVSLNISDISQITQQHFEPNLSYLQNILKTSESQQSTLLQIVSSQATIQNTNISNLKIKNKNSKMPLLIQSQNSNITLKNTNLNNYKSTFNHINVTSNHRIIQKVIIQNSTGTNQLLISLINASVQIQNKSLFSNSSYGGAVYINGFYGSNKIINSRFERLVSLFNGGAIAMFLQSATVFNFNIISSKYISNQSINGRGGAIFVSSTSINPVDQNINISQSYFQHNQAQVGGVIFQQGISPILSADTFNKNHGFIFGDDSFSYATKLHFVKVQEFLKKYNGIFQNINIVIQNFRSGGTLKDLQFELMNDQNEVIYLLTEKEQQTYNVQVKIDQQTQNYNSHQIRRDENAPYDQKLKAFRFDQLIFVAV